MNESRSMLAALNASFPDIASMHPLAARAAVDARIAPAPNFDAVAATEDRVVPSDAGGIPVRIYHPHEPVAAPTTVYAHGGGFVHGSIAGHDRFCRVWAARTGSTVVSLDYRLAPEHLAPAPVYDMVAVAEWVHEQGLAPHGVVLAGDSSGANLAAVTSIVLRDRGAQHAVGQVLIYPLLDPAMRSASHLSRAEGYFVTARSLRFYWETYLGGAVESVATDWRVAPQTAADLSGLPHSITITAGLDPLCDEGREHAALLRGAGNTALHRNYPDQFHGFLSIPNYSPADSAQETLWTDFADAFVHPQTPQEHSA